MKTHKTLFVIFWLLLPGYISAQQVKATKFLLSKSQPTIIEKDEINPSSTQKGTLKNYSDPISYLPHVKSGPVVQQIFSENFEGDVSPWRFLNGKGVWQIGEPKSGPSSSYDGAKCAGTNLNGNYPDNTEDGIYSPDIDIPSISSIREKITLRFFSWYELETNYDFGYVYITSDNGANWSLLNKITGTSSGWKESAIDVSAYAGERIILGFLLVTDLSYNYPGWYIDAIKIESELSSDWIVNTGGDLDIFGGWSGNLHSGWDVQQYTPPMDFNILVDESITSYTHFALVLSAFDVDATGVGDECAGGFPEVDNVYFNGHYVGKLTGANDSWSISTFEIKKEWVKGGTQNNPGVNKIEVYIDVLGQQANCEDWAAKIDWASLSPVNSSSNGVGFSTSYSDKGTDQNGNGKYDYLDVTVTINVDEGNSGNFNMNGVLQAYNGSELSWATKEIYLNSGSSDVVLRFDGKSINSYGIDGPYYLKNTTIYNVTNPNVNGWIVDAYTTKTYKANEFEAAPNQIPLVISHDPEDGEKVSTDSHVSAVFNIDMQSATINNSTFTLKQDGKTINGSVTYTAANRTASFIPSSLLENGKLYQATLTTGIKASNGLNLPFVVTWSFTVSLSDSFYLAEKQKIINNFLNADFYTNSENQVEAYLNQIRQMYLQNTVTEKDTESVARLYLPEFALLQSMNDADTIASIATRGLTGTLDIAFFVVGQLGGIIKSVEKIPWIGKTLAWPFIKVQESVLKISGFLSKSFIVKVLQTDPVYYNWGWRYGNIVIPKAAKPAIENAINLGYKKGAKWSLTTAFDEVADWTKHTFFMKLMYEPLTSDQNVKALNYALSNPPVFNIGGFSSAHSNVNNKTNEMEFSKLNAVENGNTLLTVGDYFSSAAEWAGLIVAIIGIIVSVSSGAGIPAALATLATIISSLSLISGGLKLSSTATMSGYMIMVQPEYLNQVTQLSFDQQFALKPNNELASNQLPIFGFRETPANPVKTRELNISLVKKSMRSSDEYINFLQNIKQLINNNNSQLIGQVLDSLSNVERDYSDNVDMSISQLIAAYPAASNLISNFDLDYFQKVERNAVGYRDNSAVFYTLLAAYGLDPLNEQYKASIVNQINILIDAIHLQNNSVDSATTAIIDSNIKIPAIVEIKNVRAPYVVERETDFKVTSVIKNLSLDEVKNVVIKINLGDTTDVIIDQKSKSISSLTGNQESPIEWNIRYNGPDSIITGSIEILPDTIHDSYGVLSSFPVVIYITSETTPVEEYNSSLPKSYSMSQNYPNPFNPITSISYSIPTQTLITIKVYDILGNEMAILVNEEKPAGAYEVSFNAGGLPSGVYFYRIQAGNYINTKKLVLMK